MTIMSIRDKNIVRVNEFVSYGRMLYRPENKHAQMLLSLIDGTGRRSSITREQLQKAILLGVMVEIIPAKFTIDGLDDFCLKGKISSQEGTVAKPGRGRPRKNVLITTKI